jgi:glutathione peroxidase-family protein
MCTLFRNLFRKNNRDNNYDNLFNYNQLLARSIIIDSIGKNLYTADDGLCIEPNSEKRLHVVIYGNDDLLLHVARQIALLCHFPNFDDETGINRSLITFVIPNQENLNDTVGRFKDITGNLLELAAYWDSRVVTPDSYKIKESSKVQNSFLDFEFSFVALDNISFFDYLELNSINKKNVVTSLIYNGGLEGDNLREYFGKRIFDIKSKSINLSFPQKVDVRRAKLVNVIYDYSSGLSMEQANDIEKFYPNIKRYIGCRWNNIDSAWNELAKKGKSKELMLSNIFCADCFDVRLNCLSKDGINDKDISNLLKQHIDKLAKSEHARWNVEKYILGYRHYNEEEKLQYANMSDEKRKQDCSEKKANGIHVDLCSYTELESRHRVDKKYDYFLILAMDKIIKKANK